MTSSGVNEGTASSRWNWDRILRLLVPLPRGKGLRANAGWIARRIVYSYIMILVMLATFQRWLIYQPTRAEALEPEKSGLARKRVENLSVKTADGLELHGWLVWASGPAASIGRTNAQRAGQLTRRVVIYFPGNAGHRGYRGEDLDLLSRLGADVYLVDYRGYGDNPGRPSEEKIAADAHAIWNHVTGTRGTAPGEIVIFGESLGGGVATRLAAELCTRGAPPGGLILRSTFCGLSEVAAYHYPWLPVRRFLIDRFPSVERIASVTCPILIVHGTEDDIVPLRLGRRLFEAAPQTSSGGVPKKFAALIGAGHNDILYIARDAYTDAVREFLNDREPTR